MSDEELKQQREQLEAYQRRNEIRIGDRFIWCRGSDRLDCTHITSGNLPKDYMVSCNYMPAGWTEVLTVCRVFEGKNGYGPFVDYWLTKDPLYLERDKKRGIDRIIINGIDCIIINGVDAFKMERWEDVLDLPDNDYVSKYIHGKKITICTERQIITHCIGLDDLHHKPYLRNGRLYYRPYRNYFNTFANDPLWNLLCDNGLAAHGRIGRDGTAYFCLTRKGLDWLGRRLNVKIYDEED